MDQSSKIVYRPYAKKAQEELPSLEEYEEVQRKAQESGKVVVLQQEMAMPQVA